MAQDEQNPETQDPADGHATHDAEFGAMTFVTGGKAMSMEELKAHQDEKAQGQQELADCIREDNETRQKMRDEGVY